MHLLIVFRDGCPASEQQASFARQHLAAALDRFGPRIAELRLSIAAARLSRPDVGRACSLAIRVFGGADVHLLETGTSTEACVLRLTRRAARALACACGERPRRAAAGGA